MLKSRNTVKRGNTKVEDNELGLFYSSFLFYFLIFRLKLRD